MSARACAMAPLVEARRDGRLDARDVASLERHLAACAECRALSADLDRLADLARCSEPPSSPIEHQRGRMRLLQAAAQIAPDEAARDVAAPPPARAPWKTAVAIAAIAIGGLAGGRGLSKRLADLGPRIENTVRPNEGARYERSVNGGTEVVSLFKGSIEVGVRPLAAGERFLVNTSDAEIETRDALLRVVADAGRLRAISVAEGTVEVRYAREVVILRAGERWKPPHALVRRATPSPGAPPSAAPRPGAPALP